MRKLLAIAILFFSLPAAAQQMQMSKLSDLPSGTYKLDPTHASVTWKVSHMGLSRYTARFTKFDATLDLDTKSPEKSKVDVTLDPSSLKTDYPNPEKVDFDKELTGKDWMNTAEFPEVKFVATKLVKTGKDKAGNEIGKMTGDLTFLGVTKPLTLDVVLVGATVAHPMTKGAALGFSASGVLKRSEWGFSKYVPMIGDDVTLQIEAEFQKAS